MTMRAHAAIESSTGDAVGDLVIAARAGSSAAFDELYRAHVPMVATLARTRASRDQAVVNDVVQEVFTRALERLDQLRDPRRFGAWVRAIAMHVIIDHHRAAARARRLDTEEAERIESTDLPPHVEVEGTEAAVHLRRAVARLSTRDATAIILVAALGLRPAELGEVLGLSPGAAKVALHRARTRLRSALAEEQTAVASSRLRTPQRSGTGPVA
jgi:RNA polymerase sigma-70 factor, ECF subfamily